MQALENDFCPGGTIIFFFFHAELTNWEMMNTLPLYLV